MNLYFDVSLANGYKSNSQRARIITESWVAKSIYCPNCGNSALDQFANNTPAADFFCSACNEQFELKSKKQSIGKKIVDGEYRTMISRLESSDNPNLLLLNYKLADSRISNFLIIPKHFFVTNLIEKRNPLSESSKRAGWTGCNILIHKIPEAGKIFLVKNGVEMPKDTVRSAWDKTLFLKNQPTLSAKGWLLDVMKCIDKLHLTEFSLDQLYLYESHLANKYPANKHVKDKIRQQLQLLRDNGYLEFVRPGRYRLV